MSCSRLDYSSAYQLFMELGITGSFQPDSGGGFFQGMHVVGGELEVCCAEVFFQWSELRLARDENDPRLLRQQPREGDLRGSGLLLFCEGADHVDQGLVRFAIFGAEPWHTAAEVGAVELRLCIDFAGQEAFAQWAKRHEADPKLFQRGHH